MTIMTRLTLILALALMAALFIQLLMYASLDSDRRILQTRLDDQTAVLKKLSKELDECRPELSTCEDNYDQCADALEARDKQCKEQVFKIKSENTGLYVMYPCDMGRDGLCFGPYPGPGIMTD